MPGGFGGFPGGGGGRPQKDVDTTALYEVLGLEKTCTQGEIKKAFRNLARKNHPDKGGDENVFKKMNAAYEVLSDEESRAKYDKYGLEGLEEGGGGGGHDDIFSMFFGGGRRGRKQGPRKGEDVVHPLKVSLEDLYKGKTVKLAVNRQKIIGEATKCSSCNGQGAVLKVVQLGPGMLQQIQQRCPACNGQCYNMKTKKERKVLEVLIERGMTHHTKIPFRGEADEKPNMDAGDVIFVIEEKDHETYTRKGSDLLYKKSITLRDALCGFDFMLEQLDGRMLHIVSKPGEIIKCLGSDGTRPFVKVVDNEGMPTRSNPYVKGKLYVLFSVEFPEDGVLTGPQIKSLKEILPGSDEKITVPEDADECTLEKGDLEHFGKVNSQDRDAYDSDEGGSGGHGGAQGVQCAQQ